MCANQWENTNKIIKVNNDSKTIRITIRTELHKTIELYTHT